MENIHNWAPLSPPVSPGSAAAWGIPAPPVSRAFCPWQLTDNREDTAFEATLFLNIPLLVPEWCILRRNEPLCSCNKGAGGPSLGNADGPRLLPLLWAPLRIPSALGTVGNVRFKTSALSAAGLRCARTAGADLPQYFEEFPSRKETIIFNYRFVCPGGAPDITVWGNRSHCTCKEQVGVFWSAVSKHLSKNVSNNLCLSQNAGNIHTQQWVTSHRVLMWYMWRNPHLNAQTEWNNIDLMEKTIDIWGPWTINPFRNILSNI